jgi:hypothetical protein
VSIDTGTNSLLVEIVVKAQSHAGALGGGVAVIDTALQAGGVEKRMALRGSTVRTEDVLSGQQPSVPGHCPFKNPADVDAPEQSARPAVSCAPAWRARLDGRAPSR